MKKDTQLPELLTMRETSEFLKVHPNTLRQWDKKSILKAVRFGTRRDRKYIKEDVLSFVKQNSNHEHTII